MDIMIFFYIPNRKMINYSRIASKVYSKYFVKPSYENLTSGPNINVWYEDENFLWQIQFL